MNQDVKTMKTEELVAEYNKLTGKATKKFETRAKGEAAVLKARAAKEVDALAATAPPVVARALPADAPKPAAKPAPKAEKPAPKPTAKKVPAKGKKKPSALEHLAKEVTKPSPKKPSARAAEDTLYKVVDDSSVKRGAFVDFVAAAKKLGKFTRAQLLATSAAKKIGEASAYKFGYAVRHGIFGEV